MICSARKTGASTLMLADAGLLAAMGSGFAEGFAGEAVTQKLLNENGEIGWAQCIRSGVFTAVMDGGLYVKRISGLQNPEYKLQRKSTNTGDFHELKELMQIKNVKRVADKAGIGLEGIKIKIVRDSELIGKGVYGFTDGRTITLYPDAFKDTEY